jgi:hypothetical protein
MLVLLLDREVRQSGSVSVEHTLLIEVDLERALVVEAVVHHLKMP